MPLLTDATAIYVGDTPAQKVYLGDVEVWPSAPPYGPPQTGYTSQTPASNSSGPQSYGNDVQLAVAGRITKLRHYWQPAAVGTARAVKVWSDVYGILQSSATVTRSSGFVGWTEVALPTPLIVTAGQIVRVSADVAAGDFCARNSIASDYVNGDVTISVNGWMGAEGGYPNTNFQRKFFVDVVFEKAL